MEQDREEQIRKRAYEIWQQEGCPEGRDVDIWQRAERQVEEASAAATVRQPDAEAPAPKRRGRRPSAAKSPTKPGRGRQTGPATDPV